MGSAVPDCVTMHTTFDVFVYGMVGFFVLGMAGCVIVIPVTAYRLFHVLFERDQEGER
jgi:hypothetical protein